MRIDEFENIDNSRIMALATFLLGRAKDTGASKTISTQTFLSLSRDLGINMTVDQLKNLSQKAPLNSVITDVQGDENGKILFKGDQSAADSNTMNVDQAQKIVSKMAKRAAKRDL